MIINKPNNKMIHSGKTITFLAVAAISAAALAGCAKEQGGYGTASFIASADEIVAAETKATVSLGLSSLPSASDFKLSVTGDSYSQSYTKLSAYDATTKYDVGTYKAEVSYGDVSVEAFDTPCFKADTSFVIADKQNTAVVLKAKVQNSVVSIYYTDAFKKYFTDYTMTLKTSTFNTELAFAKGETRKAFISPATFSISGKVTTQTGETKSVPSTSFSGIAAGTYYKITYDVNGGAVGTATITVTIDDSLADTVTVSIDLNS
jgi:hypothetical protein